MIEQATNKTNQEAQNPLKYYSSSTGDFGFAPSLPDPVYPLAKPDLQQLSKDEKVKMAIEEIHIGQRIHEELKRQGRSVAWLALQLGVKRNSLYYTFQQNSIDLQLLLHISAILSHDFTNDVADIYRKYRL